MLEDLREILVKDQPLVLQVLVVLEDFFSLQLLKDEHDMFQKIVFQVRVQEPF